jgi:hypothetical protein
MEKLTRIISIFVYLYLNVSDRERKILKQMMYKPLRPLPDAEPVPHDVYILLRYRIFSLLGSHTRYSLPSSSPHTRLIHFIDL